MEEPKIIFGVWHPANGHPDVPENLDFGAWYSLEDGICGTEDFDEGDWLVYICENPTPDVPNTKVEYWKKSEGLAIFDQNNSISSPDPGWYSKVRIDSKGNVVEGDYINYDDLPSKFRKEIEAFRDGGLKTQVIEIAKEIFQVPTDNEIEFHWNEATKSFTTAIKHDETLEKDSYGYLTVVGGGGGGGSENCCATHTHTIDQIEGLDDHINELLLNYSYVEEFKNHLSEFVDGTTITINSNGKLAAISMEVGPHTHSMDEIRDLDPDKADVWASDQQLHNELDFNEGELPLANESVGSSIYYINRKLKEVKETAEEAKATASGVIDPGIPGQLAEAVFTIKNKPRQLYNIKTKELEDCYKSIHIGTDSKLYFSGNFIYKIYLDDSHVPVAELDTRKVTDKGKYKDGFEVTYLGEGYPNIKTFQGKYKGISFDWTYEFTDENFNEGIHKVVIEEFDTIENKTISKTDPIEIPIYKDVLLPAIETDGFPNLLMTKVSGVSRYSGDANQFCVKLKALCIRNLYAPQLQFKVKCNLKPEPEYFNVVQNSIFGSTAYKNYYIEVPNNFEGQVRLEVSTQDCSGNWCTPKTILSKRFHRDTTTLEELYRQAQKLEETDSFVYQKFDSNAPLDKDRKDCLFENNIAKITHKNYEILDIGPDYSDMPNEQNFVLKFDTPPYFANFYFDIVNDKGNTFKRDKYRQLEDIDIYAGFSNHDNVDHWINCNRYWDGNSTYNPEKDFNGLDLFRSDAKRRWVTLGPQTFTKTKFLFLKVVLKNKATLDLNVLVNSIRECMNER